MAAWTPAAHDADWRLWPAREAVTLREATAPGTYADRVLAVGSEAAVGKFRGVRFQEQAASGGAFTAADRVVLIPQQALPVAPKVGDVVLRPADGTSWTVLEVGVGKWGRTHRLTCRNLQLVYQLRDLATVKRSSPTPGPGGFASPGYQVLAAAVPCKLQPAERSTEDDLAGGAKTVERYDLYLGQPLPLGANDVAVVAGVAYRVTGQSDVSRLDTLTRVAVERVV